jgi:hypothetical protein
MLPLVSRNSGLSETNVNLLGFHREVVRFSFSDITPRLWVIGSRLSKLSSGLETSGTNYPVTGCHIPEQLKHKGKIVSALQNESRVEGWGFIALRNLNLCSEKLTLLRPFPGKENRWSGGPQSLSGVVGKRVVLPALIGDAPVVQAVL